MSVCIFFSFAIKSDLYLSEDKWKINITDNEWLTQEKNLNVAGMMKCHLSVFVTWTYGMHGIDAADLHTD